MNFDRGEVDMSDDIEQIYSSMVIQAKRLDDDTWMLGVRIGEFILEQLQSLDADERQLLFGSSKDRLAVFDGSLFPNAPRYRTLAGFFDCPGVTVDSEVHARMSRYADIILPKHDAAALSLVANAREAINSRLREGGSRILVHFGDYGRLLSELCDYTV